MTDKVHQVVEAIAAALKHAQENPIMLPCPNCNGKGYHHGFGEHGHDPDWCLVCGGDQVIADPYQEAKAAAKVLIEECAKVATVVADRYPDKHDAYSMGARQAAEYIAGKITALAKDMGLEPPARSEMGM